MFHPLTHSLQKFKYFEVGGNRHILIRRNIHWALVELKDMWDRNGKVLRILACNVSGATEKERRIYSSQRILREKFSKNFFEIQGKEVSPVSWKVYINIY